MTKPDAYMPFYWNEFWQAVELESDQLIVCYLRALSYYWHHTGCAGIENDDDRLRRLCRVDLDDWEREVRVKLFSRGGFFYLEGSKWHNKRAKAEWARSTEAHARSVKGGANRWKGMSKAEKSDAASRAASKRWAV